MISRSGELLYESITLSVSAGACPEDPQDANRAVAGAASPAESSPRRLIVLLFERRPTVMPPSGGGPVLR